MANLGVAAVSLGKLIGILDGSGSVRWVWFTDPLNQALQQMPANRVELGPMIRALINENGTEQTFEGPAYLWEPINLGEDVGVGFVWSTTGDLDIGVGAKAAFTLASEQISALLLARLLKITPAGVLLGQIGQVRFGGTVPVPDFLESALLAGDTAPSFHIDLAVTDKDARERVLTFPNSVIAWDAARLAVFVLQSWVRQQAGQQLVAAAGAGADAPMQAAASGNFFQRVDEHLFPMLGDPETSSIKSFPLVGDTMGEQFDITNWKNSVFSTDNGAEGALTFLWHLRALLTGNESPDFFSASYHFPLVGGPSNGQPPVLANGQPGYAPGPNSAWFSMGTANNTLTLSLDLFDATGTACSPIVLGSVNTNGDFTRPVIDNTTFTSMSTFLSGIQSQPLDIGLGKISATFQSNTWRVTLLNGDISGSGLNGFNGLFEVQLRLEPDAPVAYSLKAPLFDIDLPPNVDVNDQKLLFATIFQWLMSALPEDATGPLGNIPSLLATFVKQTIEANGNVDTAALIEALAGVLGNGTQIKMSDNLLIEYTGGQIKPTIQFGPIKPEQLPANFPIYIGKIGVTGNLSLGLNTCSFNGFGISITDLRFGAGGGDSQVSGLVASLLPDLREVPGFKIALEFTAPSTVKVTGGGKIPIQQSIGPLNVAALMVDLRENSLSVGLDLSFQMAMITVAAYELGIHFPFDGSVPTPFLHGLGLSFDAGGIKLAGMFAEVKIEGQQASDYVGGAVVSVVNMFELSAIGGYTEIDGQASLFIFASLVAPLGGPPWFFITGVAGGFGYNRSLPPAGLLVDHPFMQVMRGEIDISGTAAQSLAKLSGYFVAALDQHWIAAGLQFTCFGFINGKVVVAVGFGHKFSLTILGLASFGISPIAYFELGIEATADEEKFLLKAGLSKNSYIIHPDIFSLHGDFALGIWHAAPNAGDFVLSIGGYHPYFTPPEHYPTLTRVGCKAFIYGFIRLSVECFFACTPQAIMAGASISLSAEFAGIGAGLDVYIDVFIRWDPFFLRATMGVTVWFEFFGRHEIGVELQIHTPPLGGLAIIDLAVVSFEVEFGHQLDGTPTPAIYEFVTRQIGVPAAPSDGKAKVAKYNTETEAGLFRVDMLSGRPAKQEQSDTSKQEGIDTPIVVAAEFAFSVRTRLPIKEVDIDPNAVVPTSIGGEVDLPLCKKMDLATTFSVTAEHIAQSIRARMTDFFPAANFGEELKSVQADGARKSVAKMKDKDRAIALTEGIVFTYEAKPEPLGQPDLAAKQLEISQSEQDYPLPLGSPQPMIKMPKMTTQFSGGTLPVHFKPKAKVVGRREAALASVQSRKTSPLHIFTRAADMQRWSVPMKIKNLTVAAPPAGAAKMQTPASPNRRSEMFGIQLRIVPVHAPVKLTSRRMETLTRAQNLTSKSLTPRGGATGIFKTSVGVPSGKATHLDLNGGRITKHTLALTGTQTVRAIFLGGAEDPIADTYVTGAKTFDAPARARRVVFIGEGFEPPVAATGLAGSTPAMAIEAIGVEHDSVLLAVGRRVYAAHGCLLEINTAIDAAPDPLDSVPGFELLETASNVRLYFPAIKKGWGLMIAVQPITDNPGVATDEIRWASMDAELGNLNTVIGPDATAFVMPVTAIKPWTLDIDLGKNWRLRNVAVCPSNSRDLANLLRVRSDWDFVDDRFTEAAPGTTTKINVEVA